jgi:hypothetical protein
MDMIKDRNLAAHSYDEKTAEDLAASITGNMPYFVDVSIYDWLSNLDLKAHIDRVGKVLYSK